MKEIERVNSYLNPQGVEGAINILGDQIGAYFKPSMALFVRPDDIGTAMTIVRRFPGLGIRLDSDLEKGAWRLCVITEKYEVHAVAGFSPIINRTP